MVRHLFPISLDFNVHEFLIGNSPQSLLYGDCLDMLNLYGLAGMTRAHLIAGIAEREERWRV